MKMKQKWEPNWNKLYYSVQFWFMIWSILMRIFKPNLFSQLINYIEMLKFIFPLSFTRQALPGALWPSGLAPSARPGGDQHTGNQRPR